MYTVATKKSVMVGVLLAIFGFVVAAFCVAAVVSASFSNASITSTSDPKVIPQPVSIRFIDINSVTSNNADNASHIDTNGQSLTGESAAADGIKHSKEVCEVIGFVGQKVKDLPCTNYSTGSTVLGTTNRVDMSSFSGGKVKWLTPAAGHNNNKNAVLGSNTSATGAERTDTDALNVTISGTTQTLYFYYAKPTVSLTFDWGTSNVATSDKSEGAEWHRVNPAAYVFPDNQSAVNYNTAPGIGNSAVNGISPALPNTLPTPAVVGRMFKGWTTQASLPLGTCENTVTFFSTSPPTPLYRDTTLYACWGAQTKFTVNYSVNGGVDGTAPAAKNNILYNTLFVGDEAVPVKVGAKFTSWNTSANGQGTTLTHGVSRVTGATTAYAQYQTVPAFDVTLNMNNIAAADGATPQAGDMITTPGNFTGVQYNQILTAPAVLPLAKGYQFKGWALDAANCNNDGYDADTTGAANLQLIFSNHRWINDGSPAKTTAYACWTKKDNVQVTYDIAVNLGSTTDGTEPKTAPVNGVTPGAITSTQPATQTLRYNEIPTLPDLQPEAYGYAFTRYVASSASCNQSSPGATYDFNARITTSQALKVCWENRDNLSINFSNNFPTNPPPLSTTPLSPTPVSILYNAPAPALPSTPPTAVGYNLSSWKVGDAPYVPDALLTAAVEVKAIWNIKNDITVRYHMNFNTPSTTYNSNILQANSDTSTVDFLAESFGATLPVLAANDPSPGNQFYQSYAQHLAHGYSAAFYTLGADDAQVPVTPGQSTIVAAADQTDIYIKWTPVNNALRLITDVGNLNSLNNCETSRDTPGISLDSPIVIQAAPCRTGYTFLYYQTTIDSVPHYFTVFDNTTKNNNGLAPATPKGYFFMPNQDVHLTAVWAPVNYNLTLKADPSKGNILVDGDSTPEVSAGDQSKVIADATVEKTYILTPILQPGYTFERWTVDGVPQTGNVDAFTHVFTFQYPATGGDHTVEAHFKKVTYTLDAAAEFADSPNYGPNPLADNVSITSSNTALNAKQFEIGDTVTITGRILKGFEPAESTGYGALYDMSTGTKLTTVTPVCNAFTTDGEGYARFSCTFTATADTLSNSLLLGVTLKKTEFKLSVVVYRATGDKQVDEGGTPYSKVLVKTGAAYSDTTTLSGPPYRDENYTELLDYSFHIDDQVDLVLTPKTGSEIDKVHSNSTLNEETSAYKCDPDGTTNDSGTSKCVTYIFGNVNASVYVNFFSFSTPLIVDPGEMANGGTISSPTNLSGDPREGCVTPDEFAEPGFAGDIEEWCNTDAGFSNRSPIIVNATPKDGYKLDSFSEEPLVAAEAAECESVIYNHTEVAGTTLTITTLSDGWLTHCLGGIKISAHFVPLSQPIKFYDGYSTTGVSYLSGAGDLLQTDGLTAQSSPTDAEYSIPNVTPIRQGYVFDGWEMKVPAGDENIYNAATAQNTFVTPAVRLSESDTTSAIVLAAKWTTIKYKISIMGAGNDSNHVTGFPVSTVDVGSGAKVYQMPTITDNVVTKPIDPVRQGFVFKGWYFDTGRCDAETYLADSTAESNEAFCPDEAKVPDTGFWGEPMSSAELTGPAGLFTTAIAGLDDPTIYNHTENSLSLYARWEYADITVPVFLNKDGSTLNDDSNPANFVHKFMSLPPSPGTPVATGFDFVKWQYKILASSSDPNNVVDYTFGTTPWPRVASEMRAVWTEHTYSLSFNANLGTYTSDAVSNMPQTVGVAYNSTATYPTVPSRPGFTFEGWYTDAAASTPFCFVNDPRSGVGQACEDNAGTQMPPNDLPLYAKWSIKAYNVQFDLNTQGRSGQPNPTSVNNVAYHSTITEPVLADVQSTYSPHGYEIEGWYKTYDGSTFSDKWEFSTSTVGIGGHTLYAKWKAMPQNVAFNCTNTVEEVQVVGTECAGTTTPNTGASLVTAAAPTAPVGYVFKGWQITAVGDNANSAWITDTLYAASTTVSISGSAKTVPYLGVSFTAVYELKKSTVYFDNQFESSPDTVSANPTSIANVQYGKPVTKPSDPIRPGYKFKGWYTASSAGELWKFNNEAGVSPMPATDLNLYAQWESATPITITMNPKTSAQSGVNVFMFNPLARANDLPQFTDTSAVITDVVYNSITSLSAKVTGNMQATGYRFSGWTFDASGATCDTATATALDATRWTDDASVYACWEDASNTTVNVHFINNTSGVGALVTTGNYADAAVKAETFPANQEDLTFNAQISPIAIDPVATGHKFLGWTQTQGGADGTQMTGTQCSTTNLKTTAFLNSRNYGNDETWMPCWKTLQPRQISFDAELAKLPTTETAGNIPATPVIQLANTVYAPPTPTIAGYTFLGWCKTAAGSGDINGTAMCDPGDEVDFDYATASESTDLASITAYARFQRNTYTFTRHYASGQGNKELPILYKTNLKQTDSSDAQGTVLNDSDLLELATADFSVPVAGKVFTHWSTVSHNSSSAYNEQFMPASNLTLYDVWADALPIKLNVMTGLAADTNAQAYKQPDSQFSIAVNSSLNMANTDHAQVEEQLTTATEAPILATGYTFSHWVTTNNTGTETTCGASGQTEKFDIDDYAEPVDGNDPNVAVSGNALKTFGTSDIYIKGCYDKVVNQDGGDKVNVSFAYTTTPTTSTQDPANSDVVTKQTYARSTLRQANLPVPVASGYTFDKFSTSFNSSVNDNTVLGSSDYPLSTASSDALRGNKDDTGYRFVDSNTKFYTKWKINQYTLTINYGQATSGNNQPQASTTYNFGATLTSPADPTTWEGHVFLGYCTGSEGTAKIWPSDATITSACTGLDDDDGIAAVYSSPGTMPAHNIKIYALWKYVDYTLGVKVTNQVVDNTAPGGTVSVSYDDVPEVAPTPDGDGTSSYTFHDKQVIKLTATPAPGYKFDKFEQTAPTSDEFVANPTTLPNVTQNRTITAHFVPIEYTLNLSANCKKGADWDTNCITANAVTIQGTTTAAGTYTSTSATGSIAQGVSLTYILGQAITLTPIELTGYQQCTAVACNGTGKYTITGGSVDASADEFTGVIPSSGTSMTLAANFTVETYTASVHGAQVNEVDAGTQTIAHQGGPTEQSTTFNIEDPALTVTATPAAGYEFADWSVAEGSCSLSVASNAQTTFTPCAKDSTYTAQYNAKAITVGLSIGAHNIIASTTRTTQFTVTYNQSNASPDTIAEPQVLGYSFGGYYTQQSGEGTQIIDANGHFNASVLPWTTSTANTTLYAHLVPATVTVTVNANETADPVGDVLSVGKFSRNGAYSSALSGTLQASVTAPYNATVASMLTQDVGKLTNPTGDITGYKFDHYSTSADSCESADSVGSHTELLTGNITVYACWKKMPLLTITYDKNLPTGETTSDFPVGNQVLLYNTSAVTPTPTPAMTSGGYRFLGWKTTQLDAGNDISAGDASTGGGSPFNFTGTKNLCETTDCPAQTAYAAWSAKLYTFKYYPNTETSGSEPSVYHDISLNYGKNVTTALLSNTNVTANWIKAGYVRAAFCTLVTPASDYSTSTCSTTLGTEAIMPAGNAMKIYSVWSYNESTINFYSNITGATVISDTLPETESHPKIIGENSIETSGPIVFQLRASNTKAEGYEFKYWSTATTCAAGSTPSTPDVEITYDSTSTQYFADQQLVKVNSPSTINLYACWAPRNVTIIYGTNHHASFAGSVYINTKTGTYGAAITGDALPSDSLTEDPGYVFDYWSTSATDWVNDGSSTKYTLGSGGTTLVKAHGIGFDADVPKTITLHAHFKIKVIFDGQGYATFDNQPEAVVLTTIGGKVDTPPSFVNTHPSQCTVTGWKASSSLVNFGTQTFNEPVTLEPVCTPTKHTVTLHLYNGSLTADGWSNNNATGNNTATKQYDYNQALGLESLSPTNSGFEFGGWSVAGTNCTEANITGCITDGAPTEMGETNLDFYAIWVKKVLTINPSSTVTFTSQVLDYPETVLTSSAVTLSATTANTDVKVKYVELVGANPDDFAESGLNADTVIGKGATNNSLTVKPKTGLAVGTYNATLKVVYEKFSGTAELTVPLSFTVSDKLPIELSVSPKSVQYTGSAQTFTADQITVTEPATGAEVKFCTDDNYVTCAMTSVPQTAVGIYPIYYKVTVTGDNAYKYAPATGATNFTITAQKEVTPAFAAFNYALEATGADTTYITGVGGYNYTSNTNTCPVPTGASPTIALNTCIQSSSYTIKIKRTARDGNYSDSDEQTITIPARPTAPTFSKSDTSYGASTGTITGLTSTISYQYIKISETVGSGTCPTTVEGWTGANTTATDVTSITGLAKGRYCIRAAAVTSGTPHFASSAQAIDIAENEGVAGLEQSGATSNPASAALDYAVAPTGTFSLQPVSGASMTTTIASVTLQNTKKDTADFTATDLFAVTGTGCVASGQIAVAGTANCTFTPKLGLEVGIYTAEFLYKFNTSSTSAADAGSLTVSLSFTVTSAPTPPQDCPAGEHWDSTAGTCVADLPDSYPEVFNLSAPTSSAATNYVSNFGSVNVDSPSTCAAATALASGCVVEKGTTIELTAVPATGYEFDSWTGANISTTSATTSFVIQENSTVGVVFKPIKYDYTVAAPACKRLTTEEACTGTPESARPTISTQTTTTTGAQTGKFIIGETLTYAAGTASTGYTAGTPTTIGATLLGTTLTGDTTAITVTPTYTTAGKELIIVEPEAADGKILQNGAEVTGAITFDVESILKFKAIAATGRVFDTWTGAALDGYSGSLKADEVTLNAATVFAIDHPVLSASFNVYPPVIPPGEGSGGIVVPPSSPGDPNADGPVLPLPSDDLVTPDELDDPAITDQGAEADIALDPSVDVEISIEANLGYTEGQIRDMGYNAISGYPALLRIHPTAASSTFNTFFAVGNWIATYIYSSPVWIGTAQVIDANDGTGDRLLPIHIPDGYSGVHRLSFYHVIYSTPPAGNIFPHLTPGQYPSDSTGVVGPNTYIGWATANIFALSINPDACSNANYAAAHQDVCNPTPPPAPAPAPGSGSSTPAASTANTGAAVVPVIVILLALLLLGVYLKRRRDRK
jgi:uncharacterized repeat protein (TIGR02543 family)